MDVSRGVSGDLYETALRYGPGVALVVPEGGTREAVESKKGGQRQYGDEDGAMQEKRPRRHLQHNLFLTTYARDVALKDS